MNKQRKFVEPDLKILVFCKSGGIILISRTPVQPISDGGDFIW